MLRAVLTALGGSSVSIVATIRAYRPRIWVRHGFSSIALSTEIGVGVAILRWYGMDTVIIGGVAIFIKRVVGICTCHHRVWQDMERGRR